MRGPVPLYIANRPYCLRPFLNIPWNHPSLKFFTDYRIVYHLNQLRRYYQLPICVSTRQVILHNIRELNVRLAQLRLSTHVWPTRKRHFDPCARYHVDLSDYLDDILQIPDNEIPTNCCLQSSVSTSYLTIPWARDPSEPLGGLI